MRNRFFTLSNSCLLIAILLFSIGVPFLQAHAQITPSCGFDGARGTANGKYVSGYPEWEGCKLCDFFTLGNNILNFLFLGLIPVIAVIMFVIGGFMFLVSGGNPGSLQKGKQVLKDTVVALIIIYGAWLAVDFFFVAIGITTWSGPGEGWFIINCPTTP